MQKKKKKKKKKKWKEREKEKKSELDERFKFNLCLRSIDSIRSVFYI